MKDKGTIYFSPKCLYYLEMEQIMVKKPITKKLDSLRFLNQGITTREMHFEESLELCHYMETPDRWCTDWGKMGIDHYPYLFDVTDRTKEPIAPPSGIRSSVALGGLGAGTIELRGDGSIRDFNIFNNGPADGEKVQLEEALFAIKTRKGEETFVSTLRTHAPMNLPCIESIIYEGAFPVSKLSFTDGKMPVDVKLYAYNAFGYGDEDLSATPAVMFTFDIMNPSAEAVDVSLMMSMPNHVGGELELTENAVIFHGKEGTAVEGESILSVYEADSSLAFTGRNVRDAYRSLTLNYDVVPDIRTGSIRGNVTVAPKKRKTVTFILSWYYPNRYFNEEIIGNYYTNLYDSASEVAEKMSESTDMIMDHILAWQSFCFDNSHPDWLQDVMVNSIENLAVTSIWSEDGRFRQYESFACCDLDATHVHFYRSIPYAYVYPNLLKNLLTVFAEKQLDGFVPHEYGRAKHFDFDECDYRRDNNPLYLLDMYQYVKATGDVEFLEEYWYGVVDALDWELRHCERLGLPTKIASTYDLDKFEDRDNTCYNSFNYLASLLATIELAKINGDTSIIPRCEEAFNRGKAAVEERFYNGSYYGAWWDQEGEQTTALHADSLYGQLWAFVLNLGVTTEKEHISSHFVQEYLHNNTPNGLTLLSNVPDDYVKGFNYHTTWEAGSLDWSANQIYLGEDCAESLVTAKEVIDKWRTTLNDQWDVRDLYHTETGTPWCNSHYSRQLIMWAIPMAMSGQNYNACTKSLAFTIAKGAPKKLTWFTPTGFGTLEQMGTGYKFKVTWGNVVLEELRINGESVDIIAGIALKAGFAILLDKK
ncbi:MAG: GH116 family glycosyl-hydrolase [Eubacteriales bacterium]